LIRRFFSLPEVGGDVVGEREASSPSPLGAMGGGVMRFPFIRKMIFLIGGDDPEPGDGWREDWGDDECSLLITSTRLRGRAELGDEPLELSEELSLLIMMVLIGVLNLMMRVGPPDELLPLLLLWSEGVGEGRVCRRIGRTA
jgi:hypothetical protein